MESEEQRKLQRQRLLELRAALPERERRERDLAAQVTSWLAHADPRALGFFWPIRGEPDLRGVVADWLEGGPHRVAALPVVIGDGLQFHAWTREAPMRAGDFGIPVPAFGRPVQPDALMIPCVGFDARRYRLGYGGGYYDRALARMVPWPLVVGVSFECGRVDSIDPRPHDMQVDAVITETGVF